MPIILESPIPGGAFGPGFEVAVSSSFIGPISDPRWIFDLRPLGNEGRHNVWQEPISQWGVPASFVMNGTSQVTPPLTEFLQGQQSELVVQLAGQSGVVESSTPITVTNEETAGRIRQSSQAQGEGALSPLQAQQLEETHASTFPAISMDDLLLQELTSGPQGGFVAAELGVWIMGVIVRIASVPAELRVNTADGDYWAKSLAVVRIYRGPDLWKRVPVHTSSKLIDFTEEGLVSAVAANLPIQWLLQISVQVSFADGVTGQVFLMRNP